MKPGRPPIADELRRRHEIRVYMSDAEVAALDAARKTQSRSEYIRAAVKIARSD